MITDQDEPVAQALLAFIRDLAGAADDNALSTRVDLFDSGYVDSLGVVALTAHIASAYGVHLNEQELFDTRLSTVAGIAEIIAEHQVHSQSER